MNHKMTTFRYVKQFVVAVTHFLNQFFFIDLTKNETFEDLMKELRHETKGDSITKAKLFIFSIKKSLLNNKAAIFVSEIKYLTLIKSFIFGSNILKHNHSFFYKKTR